MHLLIHGCFSHILAATHCLNSLVLLQSLAALTAELSAALANCFRTTHRLPCTSPRAAASDT